MKQALRNCSWEPVFWFAPAWFEAYSWLYKNSSRASFIAFWMFLLIYLLTEVLKNKMKVKTEAKIMMKVKITSKTSPRIGSKSK